MVGAGAVPTPFPPFVGSVPPSVHITPDQCTRFDWPFRIALNPENTVTFFLNGVSGIVSALNSKSRPTFSGKKRLALQPHAQNHVLNRRGTGAPDASRRPLPSRKQSRNGSATVTAEPRTIPFSTFRLVHFAITSSM